VSEEVILEHATADLEKALSSLPPELEMVARRMSATSPKVWLPGVWLLGLAAAQRAAPWLALGALDGGVAVHGAACLTHAAAATIGTSRRPRGTAWQAAGRRHLPRWAPSTPTAPRSHSKHTQGSPRISAIRAGSSPLESSDSTTLESPLTDIMSGGAPGPARCPGLSLLRSLPRAPEAAHLQPQPLLLWELVRAGGRRRPLHPHTHIEGAPARPWPWPRPTHRAQAP
jgi:hypothetical protein